MLRGHTLTYLYERGGIERRFGSETIIEKEVLILQFLSDNLFRLLIADVQHVLHHQCTQDDPRNYVLSSRRTVANLIEINVHDAIPGNIVCQTHPPV